MSAKREDKKTEKIKELENKIEELTSGWQRTQADFMNFKKQISEEKINLIKSANSELILDLLPVLDNFQLAARHVPKNLKNDNWAQGITQIEKQLVQILFDSGLERVGSVGEKFDENLHEAIEEVESKGEKGVIVEEVLAGYKFNGVLLRPAKVKVLK